MQRNGKTIKALHHIVIKWTKSVALWLLISNPSFAIDFSTINVSYWYDEKADIRVFSRAAAGDDLYMVFLEINKQTNLPVRMKLLLQQGYENANHADVQNAVIDTLDSSPSRFLLQIILDKAPENLLVLELADNFQHYYFPIPLENLPSFYPIDSKGVPLLRSYFSDKISFRFLSGDPILYTFQYTDDFGPADPPMGSTASLSPGLKLDESIVGWTENPMYGKYYLIQQDTFATQGITLMCLPEYFPDLRSVNELIESIGYITRKSEYLNLNTADVQKKQFDEFWLQLFPSAVDARLAIKRYYGNVRWANTIFSHYKPGWKNDPGMVYIVYGKPEIVYRFNNKEIWIYQATSFEFRTISHLFTANLKILIRKQDYEREWYTKVREMRGGN